MGKLKISDLVDEKAIDELETLSKKLEATKDTYVEVAKELSKGLKLKIDNIDDLDKLNTVIAENSKKADEATEELNDTVKKQKEVVEQTTNAISRNLAEIEKENKAKRKAYEQDKKALEIAQDILGSREANMRQLAIISGNLKANSAAQKKLNDQEKEGVIGTKELISQRAALIAEEQKLKTAKAELNKVISNEEKMAQAAEGSYKQLSLQLERLKKAYKELNETEKSGSMGKTLSEEISKLDAHLKDLSADMGEFQRNVGNYAIAQNKYSDSISQKMFNVLGISEDTGRSLMSLGESGSKGFSALKTKSTAFFKSLMGFLANPAVLAVLGIGAAVATFKWIYSYNKGLVEATKLTKQFTGATGDMLKNQRNATQAVADAFDKDFRETLVATNALAKQFGISFEEANELIMKGFASGADVTEEFLDNVKEYPAYFKEAGLSASQFIAITTQANKEGIYSDKGIDVIKEANLRLREMTTATAAALDGIGMSSKKVQEELESGSKTTFDIMQEISAKLEEFPETSAAVGTAIADIFGGPGEDAGLQYIKTLKKIDTNLDNVVSKEGKLAELKIEQVEANKELQNAIAALFDFTGGGFEEMTANAKLFVTEGLTSILHSIVDICNYFIDLYNDSMAFRVIWQGIVSTVKNGLDFIANLFIALKDIVYSFGIVWKGVFTLDWDEVKRGMVSYANALPKMLKTQMKDMDENMRGAVDALNARYEHIKIPGASKEDNPTNDNKGTGKDKAALAAAAAKEAKRIKDILAALNQSRIDLMDEGYKKEVKKMKEAHIKKLSEIEGHTKEEEELRRNLTTKYMKDLSDLRTAYEEQREKTDLENRLAAVEEGSDEELSLRTKLLEIEREAELRNAEKIGADKLAINEKYEHEIEALRNEIAEKRIADMQEDYATEQTLAQVSYIGEMNALTQKYAEGLISKEEYERQKVEIAERYAQMEAQSAVSLIEKQLSTEGLSADQREKLELELAKAKANLEKKMTDAVLSESERQKKADEDLTQKRIDNAQKVLDMAGQTIGAMSELANAMFEGDLAALDEKSEANEEEYNREIERIESQEQAGAMSKEEAEERKIAAEEKRRKKEEQIEKERQKIQHKQAVWNKATQLAQTAIATARGIMEAFAQAGPFAGPPMAAMVGALGAIQAATILATPIPKYAKGTDYHPGGMAIVGDGGKQEVVMYNGSAFVTSDRPTLVNLPRGAEVFPDIRMFGELGGSGVGGSGSSPFVLDYEQLGRGHKETVKMLGKILRQNRQSGHRESYERFKATVL